MSDSKQANVINHYLSQNRTEETKAAEFLGTIRNSTKVDIRILFPCAVEVQVKLREEAAYIVLAVTMSLSAQEIPSHLRLQRLTFNKKSNLS